NSGDNMLIGREGSDTLRGNGGADTFVFDRKAGPDNVDTIVDFTSGEDQIFIKGALFGVPSMSASQNGIFHFGRQAQNAADRVIYDRDAGELWIDADGAGGQGAKLIMELGVGTLLQDEDVFIF
ncbi:MAG: M10 family metallopeptidase C-terminal domain-containing protein, partial [Pseudomonadota bacterium]